MASSALLLLYKMSSCSLDAHTSQEVPACYTESQGYLQYWGGWCLT